MCHFKVEDAERLEFGVILMNKQHGCKKSRDFFGGNTIRREALVLTLAHNKVSHSNTSTAKRIPFQLLSSRKGYKTPNAVGSFCVMAPWWSMWTRSPLAVSPSYNLFSAYLILRDVAETRTSCHY